MRRLPVLLVSLFLAASTATHAAPFELPLTQRTLANGLTVVVQEDHRVPLTSVNIWANVGGKDDPAGRSGFAHLFEHLLIQRAPRSARVRAWPACVRRSKSWAVSLSMAVGDPARAERE